MNKQTKILIGVSVVVLITLFAFKNKLFGRKGQDKNISIDDKDEKDVKDVKGSSTSSEFPLKKGSKGAKVKELQRAILDYNSKLLPKYGADGQFGNETENAVLVLLYKKTIDSQKDIDEIKKKKGNKYDPLKEKTMNKIMLAKKLVDKYNADKRLWFIANKNTDVTTYALENNRWMQDDLSFEFKKGQMIPTTNAIKVDYDEFGNVEITIPNNKKKMFSPYDFDTILYKS